MGYYIASARIPSEQNIFLLFNEFNEFKEDLYNSFMEHVGKGVSVDLYFHNYNRRVFAALVTAANGKYTTYIIMPGKFTGIAPLLESLSGRVFLLDHFHPELLGRYSSVAQNFEKDTYEALCHGLRHIRKYERLLMVQHEKKEPQERYDGLVRFCAEHGFGHEYLASIRDREIREGDLFILVSDRDLVTLSANRYKAGPGSSQYLTVDVYERKDGRYSRTVEGACFVDFLEKTLGVKVIPISRPDELNYANNYLTIGPRRIMAVAGQSQELQQALAAHGVDVTWIPLPNQTRGYGAAHCMTQILGTEEVF